MVSRLNNERICLTGPDTAAGKLMRLYWQPVALTEELMLYRLIIPVEPQTAAEAYRAGLCG